MLLGLFTRVDTIVVGVTDLEEATAWYKDVLEFEVLYQTKEYVVLQVGEGQTPITIEEIDLAEVSTTSTYPILFANEIDAVHKTLQQRDVGVTPIENDGTNIFFSFRDPDGNKIEVCYFES
ncbi:hypothetical protein GLW05_10565 [Pontibacillus yanchengensis]|uniref:VOC domain-containing protein n=1 Tax=Pontibacillus yanchengensis TaxID=462910 RepID=A0A6I5A3F6_9BACI|nr:hypothetical protein [Pontibacillus yanchengensis]